MAAVLPLIAVSCAEELHAPGDLDSENCYGVYFPAQTGVGDLQIEPDDPTTLSFIVRRTNTRGVIRVPVAIESNFPVFTVDEIIFEDGSPVSELVIHFPSAEIATTYECTVTLKGDEYVSKYSSNPVSLNFSVTRVKWNDLLGPNGETTGKWRDGVFPEWFSVTNPNIERDIVLQERDDMPGFYRTFDVYSAAYLGEMFSANMSSICVSQHYTYINATDPDKVWIPTFQTGAIMSSQYGMMSVASYVVENDQDFDPSIVSVYGKLREGVIEFPYGSIEMKLETMGWYPTNSAGLHRIILPGYKAKDYDMEVMAGVSDKYGNLPVSVEMGDDISTVKLAVFEGTLAESAAAEKAELIAKDDESVGEIVTMDKPKTVYYSFEETGTYTVVAAGFDLSGNFRASKSVPFGYLKSGDDSNEVILSAGLICSDKYASDGLTARNSLEIYINGKDIQRLHAGLYEKSKWDEDREKIEREITESQMNKASLEQVNGTGLVLKQGYLVPGTEYVLVVKAYNGFREITLPFFGETEGPWDDRLANYDLSDINPDLIPAGKNGYYGTYHYYAVEGNMYSRAYIGDVTIQEDFAPELEYTPSFSGYEFVNIKGLFPKARFFGLEDDSYSFIYMDNLLYSFEQAFTSFYSDGSVFYPGVFMYSEDGSALSARMGLMAGFINDKNYIVLCDSGLYAEYDQVMSGFAVIAYQDQNHKTFAGLIDLVTSMLLIPEDADPDPIIDERREEEMKEQEGAKTSAMWNLDVIIRQGPTNHVESFDGFIKSSFEKARKQVKPKNYLDINNAEHGDPSSFEIRPAAYTLRYSE